MNIELERPLLRYHGGKWILAPWIISQFPKHRVYVEPFGGAASVLLRKPRSYAEIYNDLDGELVNLFRVTRDHGEELGRLLSLTPFAREEFKVSYEAAEDPIEQARRTVIRSFMGFGSNAHNRKTGFRSNNNRAGTTPAHDWANYPEALKAIIARLRGVVIENRDATEIMAIHDGEETFHYVDPPYVLDTRGPGTDYGYEMTDADHQCLAVFLHTLKGMVIVSGYWSALYCELFANWKSIAKRSLADGAQERIEVLWFSPNAWAGKAQLELEEK